MKTTSALTAFLVVVTSSTCTAFTAPVTRSVAFQQKLSPLTPTFLAEKTKEEIAQEAVFLPPDENDAADDEEGEDDDDDILDTVEKFGKGAAKVRIRILIARNAQKLSNYALYISIMESHVPYLTHKLFLFS